MGAIPQTASIPNIVNIDLANTLDFHLATTTWLKTAVSYYSELATFYIYNHTKHTADPITSQVNFFLSLGENELLIEGDQRGVINYNAANEAMFGYRMAKLDTLLGPSEVWIRTDDGLPEGRTESGTVSAYHALNLDNGQDVWHTYTENTEQLVKDNLNLLLTEYGVNTTPIEFYKEWYEKFYTSHDHVKKEYYRVMSAFPADDAFGKLSDSIGSLVRVIETTKPSSVNIMLDRNFNTTDTPITTVPPSIYDKLDKHTKTNESEMCEKVNSVFRNNIATCIRELGDQSIAHQQELSPDTAHRRRISKLQSKLNGVIAQTVGPAYALMIYYDNALNNQTAVSPVIETVIEDNIVRVDMLKNIIQNIEKPIGNSILSTRDINSPDLS